MAFLRFENNPENVELGPLISTRIFSCIKSFYLFIFSFIIDFKNVFRFSNYTKNVGVWDDFKDHSIINIIKSVPLK